MKTEEIVAGKELMPGLVFRRPDENTLIVALSGNWTIETDLPSADKIRNELGVAGRIERLIFDAKSLQGWDSGLLTFLLRVIGYCEENNIPADRQGLPRGVQRLLALASAVPERKGARRTAEQPGFFAKMGESAEQFWTSTLEMLAFIGEAFTSLLRLASGKARFRRSDLFLIIQECGAQALPIVSLISLLVGLILAFVGAIQLKMFGAQLYVADLVGIAMVRVMGAVMTGIIMAGRTGASFAAQLGTMTVNEEVDALKTMGFSAMDFLVLPRMLALFLMMPLLCLYADLLGVLGGFIVGVGMLDIGPIAYYIETTRAIKLADMWVGLFHGAVFGVLVALAGCLRGIQCGRSASAVGDATTSAVVTSIVSIIVATAIITVSCNILGI